MAAISIVAWWMDALNVDRYYSSITSLFNYIIELFVTII